MKRKAMLFIVMGSVLMFSQSGCVKKIRPVSGNIVLEGGERLDDRSTFSREERIENDPNGFSGGMNEVREETIQEGELFKARMDEVKTEGLSSSHLRDIFFEYNRASLRNRSEENLRENARQLLRHPSSMIRISGHTDERGSNEYNLALGARRARTVKRFLVAFGIASGRIEIISYGEENPFCNRNEENCWKLNRRAHFLVNSER